MFKRVISIVALLAVTGCEVPSEYPRLPAATSAEFANMFYERCFKNAVNSNLIANAFESSDFWSPPPPQEGVQTLSYYTQKHMRGIAGDYPRRGNGYSICKLEAEVTDPENLNESFQDLLPKMTRYGPTGPNAHPGYNHITLIDQVPIFWGFGPKRARGSRQREGLNVYAGLYSSHRH